jgi:hypothetical protein
MKTMKLQVFLHIPKAYLSVNFIVQNKIDYLNGNFLWFYHFSTAFVLEIRWLRPHINYFLFQHFSAAKKLKF